MNKPGQWLSDCCHADIWVDRPYGNFIYRTSPPDPIECCTKCGQSCEPEWHEYGERIPIFNEEGNSNEGEK
jgi:hypothetical protein